MFYQLAHITIEFSLDYYDIFNVNIPSDIVWILPSLPNMQQLV